MTSRVVRSLYAVVLTAAVVAGMPHVRAIARATESQVDQSDVKAAFVLNFVKFAEWPDLAPGEPIVICVMGDARLAGTLTNLTHRQKIDTHGIDVHAVASIAGQGCRVVYMSMQLTDTAAVLASLKRTSTLTISDVASFATHGGMIELFVEHNRMRFAINVTTVQRAQITLSSRLLGLAKIVKADDGP